MFRLIEKEHPTLVLDEAEFLSGRSDRAEAIRSLLNAGNRRGTTVPRCVGQGHEIAEFRVYCPKVLCRIGKLPETIADRSIVVPMQRRKPCESVERFIHKRVEAATEPIGTASEMICAAKRTQIIEAYETLELDFLQDRDAECWLPLFAMLSVADPSRLDELRECAARLTADKITNDVDDNLALRLLQDTASIWPTENEPDSCGMFPKKHKVATSEVLEKLRSLEESPWGSEVPLTANRLGRMFGSFGVRSRPLRMNGRVHRGWLWEDFEGPFSRYVKGQSASAVTPVTTMEKQGDNADSESVTKPVVTD